MSVTSAEGLQSFGATGLSLLEPPSPLPSTTVRLSLLPHVILNPYLATLITDKRLVDWFSIPLIPKGAPASQGSSSTSGYHG